MATSQNGFPALEWGDPKLHRWLVPGTNRYFVLRNGSAGFLLCHFILWFHKKVERLNLPGDVWDEWAYAYRPVRGSTSGLSNHASGTAVDLNATKYPLGTTHMKYWRMLRIRARLLMYRKCIRWGGDYEGRKDQMHFEINRPLRGCERVARLLCRTPRGRRILRANPGQRGVIFS